jgi:hypothetical protein
LSGAALIIALLAPPPLPGAGLPSVDPVAVSRLFEAPTGARLALWGTQVRWDDRWRAYVTPEVPDRAVVPVWERFETPSAEIGAPAPSFIVMHEMDCGQHAWRTTGVIRYAAANLAGEPSFERAPGAWRGAGEADPQLAPIYGAVCRR